MKHIRFKLLLIGFFQFSFWLNTRADALDNWAPTQVSTNSYGLDCVVYGSGRYVAYGEYSDYGGIFTSEDGINWTLRNDGRTSGLSWSLALVYTGGRFFALGGFSYSGISTNGIDWNITNSFGAAAKGAAFGGGKYVVLGSDNLNNSISKLYVSTNGSSWTADPSPDLVGVSMSDIAYGDGGFVAIGPGHVYFSTDNGGGGFDWWQSNIPGGSQINFCNGIFIVPFSGTANLLSYDGVSWVTKSTGITNKLGKINYANGLFMARAGAYLATSTDGTNWIQYSQPLLGTGIRGYYVATDGARLVTVGGNYVSSPNNYNGFAYISGVMVGIHITNSLSPEIILSGLVGRNYQIQSADVLTTLSNNWRTNATLQLTNTPHVWTDAAATNSQRFYRGVLLP